MAQVVVESGTGYTSLNQAMQAITNQYNQDAPGTEYEMSVQINALSVMVSAAVYSANRNLLSQGFKPWPGNSQIVFKTGTSSVLFRWVK